jgi:hypothetical protein
MRSRVIVGTTLLLLGLFAPNAPAAADPITITGGTIVQPGGSGFNPGSGNIFGTQNFSWIGNIDPNASFGTLCDLRCSPGTTADLGPDIIGTATGDVTYQDQQFRIGGSADSFGQLTLNFTSEAVLLPPAGSSATFTAPFTVSGSLNFPRPPVFGQPTPLPVPVSGAGTVTALFGPSPFSPVVGPGWQLRQLTYEFSDAPVPEPGTMLLVGGGLAALVRKRLQSKQAKDETA